MNPTNRRVREQANLPILRELISYPNPDTILCNKVAKRHGVTQQKVAALIKGLRDGPNSWTRVASAYGLPESMRPPWVGTGTTPTVPRPIPHNTPTPHPCHYHGGRAGG